MFLITWMMRKQKYSFKLLELELQELQISEKLWHNLRMCLASAVYRASPQRDAPSAGGQLRKG